MNTQRAVAILRIIQRHLRTHKEYESAEDVNLLIDYVSAIQKRLDAAVTQAYGVHRMAECAAIMAVCGYFSRMRGPDEWCCVSKDGFTKRRVGTRQLAEMHSREGWTITPLYAGSAPVPAAQAEAKVAHDVAVANVLRDALRAQECNYLCQKWSSVRANQGKNSGKSHFDDCLCRACVNERIRAMLAAKAKGE